MTDYESVINTILCKQNEILEEINSLKEELGGERGLEKKLMSVN